MTSSPINLRNATVRREGLKLLHALMPKAQKQAAETKELKGTFNSLGAQMQKAMRVDNLLGAFVYHNGKGWIGDIAFIEVDLGVGRVFGTPSHAPHATRFEAETYLIGVLAGIILTEAGKIETVDAPAPTPDDVRIFVLDGATFRIPVLMMEISAACAEFTSVDAEFARARLRQVLIEDFPEKFDEQKFDAFDFTKKSIYLGYMALLLNDGHFRLDRGPRADTTYEEHLKEKTEELGPIFDVTRSKRESDG